MRRADSRWLRRVVLSSAAGSLALGAIVAGLYLTVPRGNAGNGPVDAFLVLGTPAGMQGELTPMQRWRVDEGVREFRRGRAPHMIFSGGPTSMGVCESDVMAGYAEMLGVPAAAVLRERRSVTTLENIRNSAAILRVHGWHRVEVVSTAEHLPRAAVLLEDTDLQWRTHVAPTPDRPWLDSALAYAEEAVGTAVLRVFGERAEPVLHELSRGQHRTAWLFRWVVYRLR